MTKLQEQEIRGLLQHYRVYADYMYSEVKDGFYTQKQYEKALKKLENYGIKKITEVGNNGK